MSPPTGVTMPPVENVTEKFRQTNSANTDKQTFISISIIYCNVLLHFILNINIEVYRLHKRSGPGFIQIF